jgi:hypothetical protein
VGGIWFIIKNFGFFFISCNSKVFRVYGLGVNIDDDELLSFDCASEMGYKVFSLPKTRHD